MTAVKERYHSSASGTDTSHSSEFDVHGLEKSGSDDSSSGPDSDDSITCGSTVQVQANWTHATLKVPLVHSLARQCLVMIAVAV